MSHQNYNIYNIHHWLIDYLNKHISICRQLIVLLKILLNLRLVLVESSLDKIVFLQYLLTNYKNLNIFQNNLKLFDRVNGNAPGGGLLDILVKTVPIGKPEPDELKFLSTEITPFSSILIVSLSILTWPKVVLPALVLMWSCNLSCN